MRLSLQLALRFLREGKTQSILILLGVTIGVATFVFVAALMDALQVNLVQKTLGSQAHIVIEPREAAPRPLFETANTVFLRRVMGTEPRRTSFDQWQRQLRRVEATDGVVAACPKVTGSVLIVRGALQQGALLLGGDPQRLRRIVHIPDNMTRGVYRLGSDDVLIGATLAADLDVGVGGPVRITSEGRSVTLRVAGIFRLGNAAVDGGWVITSLRSAQTLLDRVGDVTAIDARVASPFEADEIAARIRGRTGVKVQSWMARNQELLVALRAQASSGLMIRIFVLLAVAMGIASVLIVSVVQRSGQIGIMRAVGVRRQVVLGVFLWQGAVFGIAGAALGCGLGAIAVRGMESSALFAIPLKPELLATSLLVSLATGLLSAFLPARRASRLDPAAAIRGDT
ncbi:MAG: ABC transporter permease [Myxococcales bacterium]|nr:ABC transporter permease [Myxococcales bacterium]